MPKITWQAQYDAQEPRSLHDEETDRIRELRWDLNVDPESRYTLEELQEMWDNRDESDHEG